MKMLKKTLAVVLSLVLCGSLVAPGLAATFTELQEAIDGTEDRTYGEKNDIIAKTEDGVRNVTLTGNVSAGEDGVGTVTINKGQDVVLDLNSNTMTGDGEHAVIVVTNGDLTLNDTGDGGVITGGGGKVTVAQNGATYDRGGAIYVSKYYATDEVSFTMNGGTITGNTAQLGGGVYVYSGEFTMNGGAITGNNTVSTSGQGGGVYVGGGEGTFTMNGGEISGNTSESMGGGVRVGSGASFTMKDGTISDNSSKSSGGGVSVYSGSSFTMNGGVISGNSTGAYGGGVENRGTFTMENGTMSGNTAKEGGDELYNVTGATVTLPNASGMGTGSDGKNITGWYNDFGTRWGDGYTKYDSIQGYTGQLLIKAAHDEYFVVTDSEGNELYNVEKGTEVELPVLEREGFTFIGWADEEGEIVTSVTVDKAITLVAQWEQDEPEQPTTPSEPVITPDEPEDPTVEIDEPDVPLADLPVDLEPMDNLTRGQLIRILHWMDSEPAAELATFIDVLADSDYAEAIGWAQANGIALGVGSNRFAPDEYVTRGQLIAFLNRYAQYVGSDLVLEVEGDANEVLTWAEAEEIINDFFERL